MCGLIAAGLAALAAALVATAEPAGAQNPGYTFTEIAEPAYAMGRGRHAGTETVANPDPLKVGPARVPGDTSPPIQFTSFDKAQISNTGTVVFQASYDKGIRQGLFETDGTTITTVAVDQRGRPGAKSTPSAYEPSSLGALKLAEDGSVYFMPDVPVYAGTVLHWQNGVVSPLPGFDPNQRPSGVIVDPFSISGRGDVVCIGSYSSTDLNLGDASLLHDGRWSNLVPFTDDRYGDLSTSTEGPFVNDDGHVAMQVTGLNLDFDSIYLIRNGRGVRIATSRVKGEQLRLSGIDDNDTVYFVTIDDYVNDSVVAYRNGVYREIVPANYRNGPNSSGIAFSAHGRFLFNGYDNLFKPNMWPKQVHIAVYLTDGTTTVSLLAVGDRLFGHSVVDTCGYAINDLGQVVLRVTLDDNRTLLVRADPIGGK
jgi:hypothetical protein